MQKDEGLEKEVVAFRSRGSGAVLGLIDVKVMWRVLRMVRITKEQLFWCEEKMKKLDLSDCKLQRDPSPIPFPY